VTLGYMPKRTAKPKPTTLAAAPDWREAAEACGRAAFEAATEPQQSTVLALARILEEKESPCKTNRPNVTKRRNILSGLLGLPAVAVAAGVARAPGQRTADDLQAVIDLHNQAGILAASIRMRLGTGAPLERGKLGMSTHGHDRRPSPLVRSRSRSPDPPPRAVPAAPPDFPPLHENLAP
jgi:hypothetical protein